MIHAAVMALAAGGLAAFWLVPLLAHLEMALPLAWGDASLPGLAAQIGTRSLLLALAVAAAVACWTTARPGGQSARDRWLALLVPALAAVIVLDALAVQPLGVMWLPADRLMDSFLLALILGASLALGDLGRRLPQVPPWSLAFGAIAGCVLLASPGRSEPTLSLWPRRVPGEWTTRSELIAGARLDALWAALRQAPPGRILFVRSSVPLVYRPEWWRPHSHITALAPLRAGREIVNGTFTHPSPIAGLVYTGSAANRPITRLVEQRDGITLFGRPFEALDLESFNRLAERLRISTVVALDEDDGRLDFLKDNPAFARPSRVGPFLIFHAREPLATPARVELQRWRLPVAAVDGFAPTGFAYSPLWRAHVGAERLAVRRDDLGLLEVKNPARVPMVIDLTHPPGLAEWIGLGASVLSALALLALGVIRARSRA
jgi:hypothetical protein